MLIPSSQYQIEQSVEMPGLGTFTMLYHLTLQSYAVVLVDARCHYYKRVSDSQSKTTTPGNIAQDGGSIDIKHVVNASDATANTKGWGKDLLDRHK